MARSHGPCDSILDYLQALDCLGGGRVKSTTQGFNLSEKVKVPVGWNLSETIQGSVLLGAASRKLSI